MENKILILLILMIGFSSACSDGNIEISDPTLSGEWRSGESVDIDVTITNNDPDDDRTLTTEVSFYKGGERVSIMDGDKSEVQKVSENDSEKISFDLDVDDDADFSEYDMRIRTYVNGDEENYCREVNKEIRLNAFGSCSNPITIDRVTSENGWSWLLGDEEELTVKMLASNSSDTYEVELIFVDGNYNEIEVADEELIDDVTFDNGSASLKFKFNKVDELPAANNYGLYVIARNGDECAELKEKDRTNENNPHVIVWDYNFIKMKDSPGIIITNVTGPGEVGKGTTVLYKVKVTNTGETESRVLVRAYYSGELGKFETLDFKSGTTKEVTIPVKIPNKLGAITIVFYAEYDYDTKKDWYHESSSNYNHDKSIRLIVKDSAPVTQQPPVAIVNNTPEVVNTSEVNLTDAVVLDEPKKKPNKVLWFVIFVIISIIAWYLYQTGAFD